MLACACMMSGCGQVHPADEYLIEAEALYKQHKTRQAKAQIDLAIKTDLSRSETYSRAFSLLENEGYTLDAARVGDAMIGRAIAQHLDNKLHPYEIAALCDAVGTLYWQGQDIAGAERVYIKGLSLDPENAGLLNDLGYFYADKAINLKKALELTRKAVDMQPNNGSFIDSLGWAQYKTGDYPSAVLTLQKATALEPDSAEVRYHLGAAYAKVDRLQEARIELQKALVLNPSLTDAVNLHNKLRK